jgi:hypothetical protein
VKRQRNEGERMVLLLVVVVVVRLGRRQQHVNEGLKACKGLKVVFVRVLAGMVMQRCCKVGRQHHEEGRIEVVEVVVGRLR